MSSEVKKDAGTPAGAKKGPEALKKEPATPQQGGAQRGRGNFTGRGRGGDRGRGGSRGGFNNQQGGNRSDSTGPRGEYSIYIRNSDKRLFALPKCGKRDPLL